MTRRERRILAPLAVVLALAVAAVVLYLALARSSGTSPGCVDVIGSSTLGGATYHACGKDAARWCRSEANRNATFAHDLRAQCRRAGYLD
jgi:hypothetical protein